MQSSQQYPSQNQYQFFPEHKSYSSSSVRQKQTVATAQKATSNKSSKVAKKEDNKLLQHHVSLQGQQTEPFSVNHLVSHHHHHKMSAPSVPVTLGTKKLKRSLPSAAAAALSSGQ